MQGEDLPNILAGSLACRTASTARKQIVVDQSSAGLRPPIVHGHIGGAADLLENRRGVCLRQSASTSEAEARTAIRPGKDLRGLGFLIKGWSDGVAHRIR